MIRMNGEEKPLAEPAMLDALLALWGYEQGFAVAVNGEFVPKTEYLSTLIRLGDEIDIVTPMKGG